MRIQFQPEALREMLEAQTWYESRSEGLGHEFERAVSVAVELAARQPEAHPEVAPGRRRVLVRRFPYSVFYDATEPDVLNVLAVFHHRRNPLPR